MFYEAGPNTKEQIKGKMRNLQCLVDPLKLLGNYNTGTKKMCALYFERCDSKKRKTCKSDKEYNDWANRAALLLAFNT